MDVLERIQKGRIIAIIRGVVPADICQTVSALRDGGIDCVEVTYDHSSALGVAQTLESLEKINRTFGESVALGAGTVLTPEEVDDAINAGARYIISPNTNLAVIRRTKERRMASIPGALTPSEIVQAYEAGADIVKLFPAGNLGISYIKALRGPLPHIPMTAVGGVSLDNIRSFFDAGLCGVGIGGNLVDRKLIASGDFEGLTRLARAYAQAAMG